MPKNLDYALKYESMGFSVIPIRKDKKPFIAWAEYQKRRATQEEIRGWWGNWPTANIGIVTGTISSICVIDIDSEQGAKEIERFIPESLEFPIASTPSGGKHYYFKMPDKPMGNNTGIIPGCDFRGEGGYIVAPPSKCISKIDKKVKSYAWIVKIHINSLIALPSTYIQHIKDYISINISKNNATNAQNAQNINNENEFEETGKKSQNKNVFICPQNVFKSLQMSSFVFTRGYRDNSIFHTANCLVKGGMHPQHIEIVLQILAKNCQPPYPESEIKSKIKSAIKRANEKNLDITKEIREIILSSNVLITSSFVFNCLHLSSRETKKLANQALNRFVKQGLLEKVANRVGTFRIINNQNDSITWEGASMEPFNLTLPLGLNSLVRIMPKNIIIVSGSPDAGKTAFLLNTVLLNLPKHSGNIHYFSSEMADTELRIRLENFENIDIKIFKGCKFWERSVSFQDVIKPDAINIIDFLEIDDAFYKIAGQLREIHNKLKKGIAIVALQQNPGASMGRGGTFGLEKPRLYLSLNTDYPHGQIIKIVKAKNWACSVNPNGKNKHFKIVKGCNLIESGEWEI